MNVDENLAITIGGGFFVETIIGYALKKVLKILAIVVRMFFVGLVYLQYQQIVSINWDKLQTKSQRAITTLANATTYPRRGPHDILKKSAEGRNYHYFKIIFLR